MYVDESGDSGLTNSPSRFFALSGLIIHELRWQEYLEQLISFRRQIKNRFGLRLREEIHAATMITRPGNLIRIPRNDRLTILRSFADRLALLPDFNIINIIVDKQGKSPSYDVFGMAWKSLIQRFENTLSHRNFTGPANPDERGMIFPDHTDDLKLTRLFRQLRRFNPIPNQSDRGSGYRDLPIIRIIEDPNFRRSDHSYFIQAADLAAFLLYQYHSPNQYMRRTGGYRYLLRLQSILCTIVSSGNQLGIVKL